ncbi:MAG: PQQ-binding-like beta-propeller repeat protein [Fidelibacterota bacterium]
MVAISRTATMVGATGFLISCSGRLAMGPEMTSSSHWITSHSDFARTGHLEGVHVNVPLTELWRRQFMAGVAESPVFRGETVLVPLLNGEVIALSARDGSRLGRKKFSDGSVLGLTLSGSTLYLSLTPERTSLHAYDLLEGKTLWKERIVPATGAPAVVMERLFVTGRNGLFCLGASDGSIIWKWTERTPIVPSPALDSGFVIVSGRDGVVTSRQIESGVVVWKRNLRPERLYSHPVVCGDRVFVTTLAGTVHAINLREGTPLWIWGDQGDPLYSSVSCDSSSLYVPSSGGKVYRLAIEDGRVEWTFDAGQLINLEVAVSDSHVVAVTTRGEILVLSRDSGRELWRTRVEGRIITPPILHEGLVLIADDRKWLYAFGPAYDGRKDP